MAERIETDYQHRLQAGAEAIELLERAGFLVHDGEVGIEAADHTFEVEATLSVGEMTRPLQNLADKDQSDSPVFASGFLLGLFIGTQGGCGADDCGYDSETGTCTNAGCPLGD